MRRTNLLGIAAICMLTVSGCTSSTKLTSVWTEPGFRVNSIRKLMVLGVSQKPGLRRIFEDTFAAALKDQGVTAVPSYSVIGEGQADSLKTNAALQEGGFDGMFVTRLVDKRTVDSYYPPTTSYVAAPSAYYGGWHGYYSTGYAYTSSPGYTVQNQVVNLETNLYRVSDGKLVWSALSQSWLEQAEDPSNEIKPFVRQLVAGLGSSKVLTKRDR